MAHNEDILQEIEELGRLTPQQELILYNIALKQDELGRESTNMLYEKLQADEDLQTLIDRELLTFELFNHGSKHEIASLYVTLKGTRYAIMFADETSRRRKLNPAGAPWEASGPLL